MVNGKNSLPKTIGALESLLADNKRFKKLSKELFGKSSSCPRVLKKKMNCKPDASTMMKAVMCRTWYSPGGATKKELLVTTFRRNMRKAWAQYNVVCKA